MANKFPKDTTNSTVNSSINEAIYSTTRSTAATATTTKTTMRKNDAAKFMFPGKLFDMMVYIEEEGLDHVISWVLDGRGFMIHNETKLVEILPKFFSQTKYRSFRRQLNMWHWQRVGDGIMKGAFIHPFFIRGNKEMCCYMSRQLTFNPTEFENNILAEMRNKQFEIDVDDDDERRSGKVRSNKISSSSGIVSSGRSSSKTNKSRQQKSSLHKKVANKDQSSSSVSSSQRSRAVQVLSGPHDGDLVSFAGKRFFFLECSDRILSPPAVSMEEPYPMPQGPLPPLPTSSPPPPSSSSVAALEEELKIFMDENPVVLPSKVFDVSRQQQPNHSTYEPYQIFRL